MEVMKVRGTYPVKLGEIGVGVIVRTTEAPAECTTEDADAELAASSALDRGKWNAELSILSAFIFQFSQSILPISKMMS
jgi:hypothetical protein